jgi:hypothetical protein
MSRFPSWAEVFPIGKNMGCTHQMSRYLPDQEDLPMSDTDDPVTARQVRTPAEIGELVRAARRDGDTDQATAAGLAGVGVRFLGDLERGKPNLRLGLVLRVLERLGLEVWIAPRGWRPGRPEPGAHRGR